MAALLALTLLGCCKAAQAEDGQQEQAARHLDGVSSTGEASGGGESGQAGRRKGGKGSMERKGAHAPLRALGDGMQAGTRCALSGGAPAEREALSAQSAECASLTRSTGGPNVAPSKASGRSMLPHLFPNPTRAEPLHLRDTLALLPSSPLLLAPLSGQV